VFRSRDIARDRPRNADGPCNAHMERERGKSVHSKAAAVVYIYATRVCMYNPNKPNNPNNLNRNLTYGLSVL
jgi:hypothetical protein